MIDRAAPLVTTLSLLAFMGWLALATHGGRDAPEARSAVVTGGGGAPSSESSSACVLPVTWHVSYVDPRFGISPDSVVSAVRRAVQVWEGPVGRDLFAESGVGQGVPVRLIYDHRQARTDERLRAEDVVRREDEALTVEVADLARAWEDQHDARASHLAERASLTEAVLEHNLLVRAWNERGGAPEALAAELTANEERLRRAEVLLGQAALRLQREEDALLEAEQELTDRITQRNAEAGRLARSFGRVAVESGAYLGAAGPSGGGGQHREIRVFRFGNGYELVRVLAHELGHALGLGHADQHESLMHGLQGRPGGELTGPRLHGYDVLALARHCGWSTSR